ncbi:MAG: Ammonia channel [Candidatus Ordinivivax streblomastigis]|uniref:Ammonium transporter n=1 Tax=Candidatus Ordinivivax streblomastigis TaxID=2540710 RepID=A0A5M8P130_9BACT|nr:MAG: Ammonia channel [Candidatus Ordinivivax streblomastigis]
MKSYFKTTHARLVLFLFIAIAGITFVSKMNAQDTFAVVTDSVTAVAPCCHTEETTPVIEAAIDPVEDLGISLNTVWMLLAAMLVFFMQPGFALVEAGFTRTKNTANILMKNFIDFIVGSLLFFLVGFGIMFGCEGAGFIGMPNFGDLTFFDNGLPTEGFLIFQTVFCATAATIVSGAMAERTKFHMYLIYTILISVLVYPVSGHWTWGGGWLMNGAEDSWIMKTFGATFHDFAGSTIVHSVGGWIALVGAWVLGPRIGKYAKDGKSKAIPGHNLTMAALGVFILWFGWFGFNPGSQLAAAGEGDRTAISHVFLTTNLAAAAGGLFALIAAWFKYKKPSLSLTLNGILAGLVGITAGCDAVSPGGAIIIGAICGVLMLFSVEFIDRTLKIDDPVGASSVHGVCGFCGTILTGLFAIDGGLFYGGGTGLLLAQLTGAIVIGLWAFGMGFIIFKSLDKIAGLRVTKRVEEEGLDIYEHGETAYN